MLMEKYADVNFVLINVGWKLGNDRWGKFHYYMLSNLPSTGQVITARLALGDVHGQQVERSRTIKNGCTGNISVVFTALEISDLGTAINNFEDRHGAQREADRLS